MYAYGENIKLSMLHIAIGVGREGRKHAMTGLMSRCRLRVGAKVLLPAPNHSACCNSLSVSLLHIRVSLKVTNFGNFKKLRQNLNNLDQ